MAPTLYHFLKPVFFLFVCLFCFVLFCSCFVLFFAFVFVFVSYILLPFLPVGMSGPYIYTPKNYKAEKKVTFENDVQNNGFQYNFRDINFLYSQNSNYTSSVKTMRSISFSFHQKKCNWYLGNTHKKGRKMFLTGDAKIKILGPNEPHSLIVLMQNQIQN